jgi:hypothetical protein
MWRKYVDAFGSSSLSLSYQFSVPLDDPLMTCGSETNKDYSGMAGSKSSLKVIYCN